MSSGRNAAAMVEIVMMNLMAQRLGHKSELIYADRIQKLTEQEKRELFSDEI